MEARCLVEMEPTIHNKENSHEQICSHRMSVVEPVLD
ncbi:hypothetical protein BMS3Bbin11_01520 [bacterium BMS3Bbin11]|nr:hypothetical protein BMS3Abin11_01171 [bacterium BMS3Abin11]GBE46419.1 hypothetical protein BMS3Bbin11_01520 [bacterium BMS3Bbin11]